MGTRITLHLKGTETAIDIVSDDDVEKAGGIIGRTLGSADSNFIGATRDGGCVVVPSRNILYVDVCDEDRPPTT